MNKLKYLFIFPTWIKILIFPAVLCHVSMKKGTTNDVSEVLIPLDKPQIIKFLDVPAYLKLRVQNIPAEITFVVFQVHSQNAELSMSYSPFYENNLPTSNTTFIQGSNIGLVVLLPLSSLDASVYVKISAKTRMLIIAQGYRESDPIPGGCDMEFSMKIAPYLLLNYNTSITQVSFQRASTGYPRDYKQPSCDDSYQSLALSYDIYVIFIMKNETSEDKFFNSLENMYNVNSIQQHARKITPVSQPPLQFEIPTYRRIGVIFNVITRFGNRSENGSAAYIPIVSYGCSFEEENSDTCFTILTDFEWILATFGAVIGGFLCFFGHRFFKTSLFFHGFSAASLIAYILASRFSDLSYPYLVSVVFVIGAVCGVFWVMMWCLMGSPMLSVTLIGFNLGFLGASIAFFTPLGEINVFTSDVNYWLLFSCIILLITVIFTNFTQKLHILGCAILGSCGIIILLDRYVAGSLTYVILNVLRRASVPAFKNVILIVPFDTTEIILSCAWALLAALGFLVQCLRERRRPPFPPSPIRANARPLRQRRSPSRRESAPTIRDDDDEAVWNYSIPTTTVASTPERQPLLGRSDEGFEHKTRHRDYSGTKIERQLDLPYA